jgi:hypothetical protein
MGKQLKMKHLYGYWDSSFDNLYRFKAKIEKECPGSLVTIEHHTIRGKIRFKRFFFSLKPCIEGFLRLSTASTPISHNASQQARPSLHALGLGSWFQRQSKSSSSPPPPPAMPLLRSLPSSRYSTRCRRATASPRLKPLLRVGKEAGAALTRPRWRRRRRSSGLTPAMGVDDGKLGRGTRQV